MKKNKYDPEKVVLDAYEQEIEDSVDWSKGRPLSPEEMRQLKAAASRKLKELKSSRTNIRMEPSDITAIRKLASEAGLPYQTFIAHVLHLFVTGQLIRVGEVKKLLAAGLIKPPKTG